jgi:hypothetical protein
MASFPIRLPAKISKFAKQLSQEHFSSVPVQAHLDFGTHHTMSQLTGSVQIPSDSAYASSYPKVVFILPLFLIDADCFVSELL